MLITLTNHTIAPMQAHAADNELVTFPPMGGSASGDFVGSTLELLQFWAAAGAVTIVAGEAPANTVEPAITGTPQEGQVLTASDGTWTGDPEPTFTYQWLADGEPIVGATADTYTPVTGDVDAMISVAVTGTNSAGEATAVSDEVGPVTAA